MLSKICRVDKPTTTHKVLLNNLNYLQSPFIPEATKELEITEEEFNKVCEISSGKAWWWNEDLQTFELVTNPEDTALRFAREIQCFSIVNRGALWLESLTELQREELRTWYQAWLDVTETGVIPERPSWLH